MPPMESGFVLTDAILVWNGVWQGWLSCILIIIETIIGTAFALMVDSLIWFVASMVNNCPVAPGQVGDMLGQWSIVVKCTYYYHEN